MNEPTSSAVGVVKVGCAIWLPAWSWIESVGDEVAVCFGLPEKTSQTPILSGYDREDMRDEGTVGEGDE